MIDLRELQKEIYKNKLEKGFSTDTCAEFCRAHEELSEAFSKYNRGKDGVAEEFADVAIFLLGMCEKMGFDLEKEIIRKVAINQKRQYKKEKAPDGRDVFIRIKTDEDP